MEFIRSIIPYMWLLSIVIIILAVWGNIYINRLKKKGVQALMKQQQWLEMMPSAISTLGVLGTFFGITLGLICFNTQNLQQSIPELLNGLKTAFFTSLAGMIGSLWLSRKVSKVYDEATGGVSDINQAASLIVNSVAAFQTQSTQQAQSQQVFYNLVQQVIRSLDANIKTMNGSIDTLNANVSSLNVAANDIALKVDGVKEHSQTIAYLSQNILANTSNIATHTNNTAVSASTIATNTSAIASATTATAATALSMKDGIDNIDASTSSIVSSVGNLEESNNTQSNVSQEINNRLGEMMDHTESMVSTEGEVSEKITALTDKLHGEVLDIEEKMAATNTLLGNKFDEFSELLKKNNTEALVEVMKKVTEEFQTQMNALITKLVQENFDQLNQSVEKLNKWQQENKEMISSLTAQYKQMSENFEGTSESLTKVKEDTKALVSDGGKLEQLITSLNEVIVQDKKFKAISSDLQKTADLSKSNMESFDQSTRKLNEWVKKQRDFSDTVAVLIKKLEELNEMKNYASTFWKDTRTGMNDAVGIIKNGSEQLNQQLTGLDKQFYARLSTTLANLDACIQSLITNARNNRK